MAKEFASRTHFVHLRNVTKEMPPAPETGLGPAGCTFTESDHLGGDVDMYSIMLTMLQEKQRRKAEGWGDMAEIPFRPDHGHKMVDDMILGSTMRRILILPSFLDIYSTYIAGSIAIPYSGLKIRSCDLSLSLDSRVLCF